jgi:amidase
MWVGATAERIATAVQWGETSATRVIVDHLDHARLADRVLDLLGVLRDSAAVAEAEQVDSVAGLPAFPLSGVPVVVAEDTAVAGIASGRKPIAERDDEIVRRLRGAGAVVLGTGRQLGNGMGHWVGPVTRNPWRGDRSPGGTSAGSAAAVAAGVVPIAYAAGHVGSMSIPAATCGLVGLTPGVDIGPDAELQHAVIATTVADAALGHAIVSGRSPRPGPGNNKQDRLRVAASIRSPLPLIRPDHATRAAVRHAARLLIALGHDVVASDPDYPGRLVRAAWRRKLPLGARADWRSACERWFATGRYDLLLLPTLAGPAPTAVPPADGAWTNPFGQVRLTAYTALWSLAGLPAVTVPMGLRPDGLPASVQLVGPAGSEALLCAVAAQVEWAAPWRRHAPGWPRQARRRPMFMARSGHDDASASNEAGHPGGHREGAKGALRRDPGDATRAVPIAVRRARRPRLAEM